MKISLDWLSDLVDIDSTLPQEELIWKLTEASAEIEHVENPGQALENVVVGEVIESNKHPDADKLTVNQVSIGDKTLPIVCGAPNMRSGLKVAVALVGARVRWHGEGDLITLEKTKIRGEVSEGMACAAEEIGLAEMFPNQDGIIELDTEAEAGTPLAVALGLTDTVLDIDNHAITHRADLFSHLGFAREIAALGLGKLKSRQLPEVQGKGELPFSLTLDPKAVKSYVGIVLKNVKNIPTPAPLARRLNACGIRSLGLLVDITNYVMLEVGMPLHAFDLRALEGKALNFRLSKKGEKVTTLDEVERTLPDNIIVADDGEKIVDLCGIMGGLNSGIKDDTTAIFLHAPVYDKTFIRRGMISLKHRTDAGTIYEKGVDTTIPLEATLRVIEILKTYLPDLEVASGLALQNFEPFKPEPIQVTDTYLKNLIGIDFTQEDFARLLPLGFRVESSEDAHTIFPPAWRKDVKIPADIAEELTRLRGYNTVPTELPQIQMRSPEKQALRETEKELRSGFVSFGFNETINYALLGEKLLNKANFSTEGLIEIENAVSEDFLYYRPSLLPRLLEIMQSNFHAGNEDLKFFEIGRTGRIAGKAINETLDFAALLAPSSSSSVFYDLKGYFEEALKKLNITYTTDSLKEVPNFLHPSRNCGFYHQDTLLGYVGEAHPLLQKPFDAKKPFALGYLFPEALSKLIKTSHVRIKPLPQFPEVTRDLALLFPSSVRAQDLLDKLKDISPLLVEASLFDVYTDKKLAETEQKSLAFRFVYRSPDRTLTEDEVLKIHNQVLQTLEKLGGKLRA